MFDAAKYNSFLLKVEGGANASWTLETSDDQLNWLVAAGGTVRGLETGRAITGRYYRVAVEGLLGTPGETSFTILGHFS